MIIASGAAPQWAQQLVTDLNAFFSRPSNLNVKPWTLTKLTSSNSAWPVPASTTQMILEIVAGGGSGGARVSSTQRGTGGGGGEYGRKYYSGTIDTTLNITIGAGGASKTGDNTAGNNGGDTSVVGTNLGTLTAKGGSGGPAGLAGGGAGGTGGTGCDYYEHGQDGGTNSWIGTAGVGYGGNSGAAAGSGGVSNVSAPGYTPGGGGSGENHVAVGSGAGAGGWALIWTR